jgi:hypothetical protein
VLTFSSFPQIFFRLETMTVRGIVDAILRNLAIHLWELLPQDIEAEVDTSEDQVEQDLVMLVVLLNLV